MRSEKLILSIICSAVAISSCETPSEVLAGLTLEVTAPAFEVGQRIQVSVVNNSDDDAFLYHCNHRFPIVLERRQNGRWEEFRSYNGPGCLAIFPSGIIHLPPGSAQIDSFIAEAAGEVRIRVDTGAKSSEIGSHALYSVPIAIGPLPPK